MKKSVKRNYVPKKIFSLRDGSTIKIYFRKDGTVKDKGDINKLIRYASSIIKGLITRRAGCWLVIKDVEQEFLARMCYKGLYYFDPTKSCFEKYIKYDFTQWFYEAYYSKPTVHAGLQHEQYHKSKGLVALYDVLTVGGTNEDFS